jgi:predicted Zn-dependent peptidase
MTTPDVAERVLPSGLTVKVVRRAAVPLVEMRLRIPTAGDAGLLPVSTLLADTTLSGTATHSNVQIATALQEVGGDLDSRIDADRLLFSGNALASGLPKLLDVLADVLTGASYPDREVVIERDRVVDSIQVALAQPSTAARRAILRRLFGNHPYGVELPEPADVAQVQPEALRKLHSAVAVPQGAVLAIVGDIEPERGLDEVERALAGWTTPAVASIMPPVPQWRLGPWQITDRTGAVQSSIRVAAPAVGRSHPEYPALQLANLIFGGYFSSRLVSNIREDKGYTYSPHSSIDHSAATSVILVDADVATEVTAPALHEINYELGRIATTAVTAEELEDVRQYAVGTMALSTATQGGLANWITLLAGQGLEVTWLEQHGKRLTATTIDEVQAAAARYLAPAAAITTVLGDADRIGAEVSRLHTVEIV